MTAACEVWLVRPAEPGPAELAILDAAERERLAAYAQQADRNRFASAAVLLRQVTGRALGLPPAAVPITRTCPDCGKQHGKTQVDGAAIQVSVTHSGDRIAVAMHPSAPVGVDVEAISATLDTERLAIAVLSPAEAAIVRAYPEAGRRGAFTRYWARKESLVKATGEGLRAELKAITVTAPDDPPAVLGWHGPPAQLTDFAAGDGYRAAVAVLTAAPVPVRIHDTTT